MSDSTEANPTLPMDTKQIFQLEEYRALRKELELYITEFRLQERNVVIGVGVMWGWLLLHPQHWVIWCFPILLTIAALLRSHVLSEHMGTISRYIQGVERSFGVVPGWEAYFDKHASTPEVRNDLANRVLNRSLLVVSILAALARAFAQHFPNYTAFGSR